MVLISLLIVLGLERIAATSSFWQFDYYYSHYYKALQHFTDGEFFGSDNIWKLYIWIFTPGVVAYIFFAGINFSIIELFLSAGLMLILIGCREKRKSYREYLQCSNRGDTEGAAICAERLGQDFNDENDSLGKSLIWLNFAHYFGVVFWFVAFSVPGALTYVLIHRFYAGLPQEVRHHIKPLAHIIDWLPARITTLGFLLVGNFSNALPLWLSYLFDLKTSAKHLVTEIAKAAEDIETEEDDCTEEPCAMVRLAKRNLLFFLSILSVLTLYGWIQ